MQSTLTEFARTKATEWFQTLERHLGELSQLDTHTRLAMGALEAEFKAMETRSSQTYHVKVRSGSLLPDAIHRVRICGTREVPEGFSRPPEKPYRHWVRHLKGRPTYDELYSEVKDVGLLELFQSFHDRATCLNSARRALVLGRTSIEKRAKALADPRAWEAGDLSDPAPLLQTNHLPHTGVRALGAAWRIFLRMAAVQFELRLLAERHNASPPHRGLRLDYRIDSEHPYGRFIWTYNGRKLSCFARQVAKGKHPKRIDDGSLPDRLMRRLHIPTAARKAVTQHERHRRRMAQVFGRYVDKVRLMLSTGPKRQKEAEELLRRAGFPAPALGQPPSAPAYLSN